jgi:thiol-disulfide isomerase/thioredoxin
MKGGRVALAMRRLVLLVHALAALFLPAPAYAGLSKGQRAPEFALPSLRGPKVSLSSLRGKVVLLDFWAEWCAPCKKELPELERLAKDYAGRVVVVGINLDKQRENAARLVQQLGVTFDVLLDPAQSVAASFDPPKMPTSYVIDQKGLVRLVNEGFDGAADIARLRQTLDQALH